MSAISPSQPPTVIFSIYQSNTWTIRCLVNEMIDSATKHIILKIVGFWVMYSNSKRHWPHCVHWADCLTQLKQIWSSWAFKCMSSLHDLMIATWKRWLSKRECKFPFNKKSTRKTEILLNIKTFLNFQWFLNSNKGQTQKALVTPIAGMGHWQCLLLCNAQS